METNSSVKYYEPGVAEEEEHEDTEDKSQASSSSGDKHRIVKKSSSVGLRLPRKYIYSNIFVEIEKSPLCWKLHTSDCSPDNTLSFWNCYCPMYIQTHRHKSLPRKNRRANSYL